jgi:hypothetical protein
MPRLPYSNGSNLQLGSTMKRILLASAALHRHRRERAGCRHGRQGSLLQGAPRLAVYNWTGFYIGVNAGVGIGRDRVTHSYTGDSLYLTPQGGFGGGQIGYNWQGDSLLGPIVYGLEADIQGSGLTGGGANVVGPTADGLRSEVGLVRHRSWPRRSRNRSGPELLHRRFRLRQRQDHDHRRRCDGVLGQPHGDWLDHRQRRRSSSRRQLDRQDRISLPESRQPL